MHEAKLLVDLIFGKDPYEGREKGICETEQAGLFNSKTNSNNTNNNISHRTAAERLPT